MFDKAGEEQHVAGMSKVLRLLQTHSGWEIQRYTVGNMWWSSPPHINTRIPSPASPASASRPLGQLGSPSHDIPLTYVLSLQFSCSVMSDSLRPHESQHAKHPCLSPTPRLYPNSCPLSRWCHPAISSSVVPFSSCPQSLPASESNTAPQFELQIKYKEEHSSFQ